MNPLISITLKEAYDKIVVYLTSKTTLWYGHTVAFLKSTVTSLKDPWVASIALFTLNFGILEIAFRIRNLVGLLFPDRTLMQKRIKTACLLPLTGGIIYAANTAFIKATKIALHPLVVTLIVAASFFVKKQLERLSDQSFY